MIIELRGVNFVNKGAQLMLCAILQELDRWPGRHTLVAHPGIGTFTQRAGAGLGTLARFESRRLPVLGARLCWPAWLLPAAARRQFDVYAESDVDAVLDASGYAYGDTWGEERCRKLAVLSRRLERRGVPFVLLPQAMGPFHTPGIRRAFGEAVPHLSLVFARDPTSLTAAQDVGMGPEKLRLAPDFTNLVAPLQTLSVRLQPDSCCIIPNERMIDKTSSGETYRRFLVAVLNHLHDQGRRPFLLVHEARDERLARWARAEAKEDVPVVVEPDPIALKTLIGRQQFIVSSRYHGLVSALSCGVPAIATSWSHKYQHLMEDYAVSELLIHDVDRVAPAIAVIDQLLCERERSKLRERIMAAAATQREGAKRMWSLVREVVKADE